MKLKSSWGFLAGFVSDHSVVFGSLAALNELAVCLHRARVDAAGFAAPVLLSTQAAGDGKPFPEGFFSMCLPCVCIVVSAMCL